MWLGLLAASIAALMGAAFALASVPKTVLHAIRVLALCSVVPAVLLDVLPEATAEMGPFALCLFALAFWLPSMASRNAPVGRAKTVLAAAFFALLVHKLLDGFALGTLANHAGHVHWDVIAAVAAHTVPMTCALGLAYAQFGHAAVWGRTVAVIAAIALGAVLSATGTHFLGSVAPAVNAIAAGLLFHLLLHDLHPPLRTTSVRLAELVGIAGGLGLSWITIAGGHADEHTHHVEFGLMMWDITTLAAPWLVLGLGVRVALYAALRTWPSLEHTALANLLQTSAPARCDTGNFTFTDSPAALARWLFVWTFPFIAVETLGFAFFSGMWWHVAFIAAAAVAAVLVSLAVSARIARRASHTHHHHEGHHHHDHAHGTPDDAEQRISVFALESISHNAGRIGLALVLAVLVLTSEHTGAAATLGRLVGAVATGILFAPLWWLALGTTLVTQPWLAIGSLAAILAFRTYRAANSLSQRQRLVIATASALGWAALMSPVPWLLTSLEPSTVLVSKVALTDWRVTLAPWTTWLALGSLGLLMLASTWTHGIASWLAGLHDHPHDDLGNHCQD